MTVDVIIPTYKPDGKFKILMDRLQKQADDSIGLIFYRMVGLSLQFSPGENHFCGGIGIHEQAVYDRQHPL